MFSNFLFLGILLLETPCPSVRPSVRPSRFLPRERRRALFRQERLNSNSRVAFDHQIVIIIGFSGKFRIFGEMSDFRGNFGFSGKFWIFGEISNFRGNFGFSGKFRIFGEISDFRGNFGFLSHHCTVAWVTRPERPKGVKDVIKQARRAQSRPEGP